MSRIVRFPCSRHNGLVASEISGVGGLLALGRVVVVDMLGSKWIFGGTGASPHSRFAKEIFLLRQISVRVC